jgi:hypothetical protein
MQGNLPKGFLSKCRLFAHSIDIGIDGQGLGKLTQVIGER